MNSTVSTILEILKFVLPAIIVIIACQMIVSKFLKNENKRRQFEVYKQGMNMSFPLRIQAYERLSLFLERMHPRGLMTRCYIPGMTVRDFQTALTQTIQQEFDHNVSQQIFINLKLWGTIKGVKEQTQMMVNEMSGKLNPDASAKELHRMMMEYIMTVESLPIEAAIQILHEEAKLVLNQQF